MGKYELKIIDHKLVIDLNKMTDDYMESYGYDGLPNKYDTYDIGPAKVIGTVELSGEQLSLIENEYKNGGECGWCGEVRSILKPPHMFDFSLKEKMCKHCWEHDRKVYLGSYGNDIGPFDKEENSIK
ncbi:hypothetical protein [Bacillus thuringiensis]|uniref:Uncharacterized protein n=1 Tax=Bacillus thuringiensis serovar andalousiensis TaxID=257985 RepID=A0A6H0TCZ1_BACTU|nr:hypothetical protein [Bacillus thuringiensis]QIW19041.1 hypothetical protein EVG22_11395 [Bacillus thuringiensis serovar andalousiensis]